MGDSDEEYDRRRARDKFRGERSDYERRPRDYRDRRRGAEEWNDRRRENAWDWNDKRGRDSSWDSRKRGGDYYRDNERTRRDSGSGGRQMSPPMKRNRRDWDNSYGDDYQNYGTGANMTPVGGPWGPSGNNMPIQSGKDTSKQNTPNQATDQGPQVPQMMTFKQFIIAQEDDIKDNEGIRRFQEYKTEFKRTQISDFFVLHKEAEWFKEKYHPVDSARHGKEVRSTIKRRLKVFLDLLDKGHLDEISLDNQCSDDIMKLLDKAVIKLEGGTDNDLSVLDDSRGAGEGDSATQTSEGKPSDQSQETAEPLSPSSVPLPEDPPPVSQRAGENGASLPNLTPEQRKLQQQAQVYHQQQSQQSTSGDAKTEDTSRNRIAGSHVSKSGSKKGKRLKYREPYHYDDDDDDESESESESDASEPAPPGEDGDQPAPIPVSEDDIKEGVSSTSASSNRIGSLTQPPHDSSETDDTVGEVDANLKPPGVDDETESEPATEQEVAPPVTGAKDENTEHNEAVGLQSDNRGVSGSNSADLLPSTTSVGDDQIGTSNRGATNNEASGTNKEQSDRAKESDEFKAVDSTTEEIKSENCPPRALHKTLSLFLRNVLPNVAKGDIVTVCKRYPGFMRVAMADPSPERRFFRRAWITFDASVNIKDICWNLSNIRIKETETNPVVNRDLSKRIRAISGITLAKPVVEFDVKFASKLVVALDDKYKLYQAEEEEVKGDEMETDQQENADTTETPEEKDAISKVEIPENNPILHLVPSLPDDGEDWTENVSDKEKKEEPAEDKEVAVDFTLNENLMKVLDKLILYLRIVHSLDYYNGADYPHEDDMPNRCGIIHIRGTRPERAAYSEVLEWKKNLKQKLSHNLVAGTEKIEDDEADKLGKKDSNLEVENFVTANTQELAKDKWLCPLSGKKFKGPEFVRKHIFNKHIDKLDAVKTEVEFFNRYLYDPKRPQFPDQSAGRDATPASSTPSGNPNQFNPQQPMYQMGWNPRTPHMMYGPRGHFTPPTYGGFRGGPDMHSRGGHTYPPKPRRGGIMRDPRSIITYKDLDAPDDADFF